MDDFQQCQVCIMNSGLKFKGVPNPDDQTPFRSNSLKLSIILFHVDEEKLPLFMELFYCLD